MTAQVATEYIAELSRPGALTAGQLAYCLTIRVQTPAFAALWQPQPPLQSGLDVGLARAILSQGGLV